MDAVLEKNNVADDLDINEVTSKLLEYEKKCLNGTMKYYTLDQMNEAIDGVIKK